jgi:hypothetical protein
MTTAKRNLMNTDEEKVSLPFFEDIFPDDLTLLSHCLRNNEDLLSEVSQLVRLKIRQEMTKY